jgi:predicted small metal-binding protein
MVSCKDLGSECAFTACAPTEPELLEKVIEHGRTVHDMKEFSPDFYKKVQETIREGDCDPEEKLDPCEYPECCC